MDRVTVFGPNLSGRAQRKGNMHVHAATCDDCKKYGPGKPMGGEDTGWTIDATTRRDVVLAIYADHSATEDDWQGYDDLYVAPCVTFEQTPPTETKEETPTHDAAQLVDAEIAEARVRLTGELKEAEKQLRHYDQETTKADRALAKVRGKDDEPISEKEQAAWRVVETAHQRYLATYERVSSLKRKLKALDDPDERARRIADKERSTTPRRNNHTTKEHTMSSTTTRTGSTKPRVKREIPQDVIDRIVKAIDSGKGVTAVAAELAADKVTAPTPSGWYGKAVYNLYVKATGKAVGQARKAHPLASRKLKDRPAAPTKRLAKTGTKSATKTAKAATKATSKAKTATKAATKKTATAKRATNGDLAKVKPDPKPSAKK
jgi:hypothetical protein